MQRATIAECAPPNVTGAPVRPLNVFFLVDSLALGGSETQAVELACRLSVRHKVTLGCLRAEGPLGERLALSAVKLVEFHPGGGIDSLRGVYQSLRLARFLRRGRFDVVHTFDLWSNLMGVPAARLARIPVVISSQRDLSHLDWYSSRKRNWLRRLQRLSDAVIVNAVAVRDNLAQADNFPLEKVHVIHNGVDIAKFDSALSWKQDFLPECVGKRIVLVGNMDSDVKGHSILIQAASHVIREFPDVRFILVGDGLLRPQLEHSVQTSGIEPNFMFLGQREDVPEILAAGDVGVLPSHSEGLPNALLEYMAAGLPSVATDVGGNRELVVDGQSGLLVPPRQPDPLAVALVRLLHDPDLVCKLGTNARRRAREQFSFEASIARVENLYTGLLAKKIGAAA